MAINNILFGAHTTQFLNGFRIKENSVRNNDHAISLYPQTPYLDSNGDPRGAGDIQPGSRGFGYIAKRVFEEAAALTSQRDKLGLHPPYRLVHGEGWSLVSSKASDSNSPVEVRFAHEDGRFVGLKKYFPSASAVELEIGLSAAPSGQAQETRFLERSARWEVREDDGLVPFGLKFRASKQCLQQIAAYAGVLEASKSLGEVSLPVLAAQLGRKLASSCFSNDPNLLRVMVQSGNQLSEVPSMPPEDTIRDKDGLVLASNQTRRLTNYGGETVSTFSLSVVSPLLTREQAPNGVPVVAHLGLYLPEVNSPKTYGYSDFQLSFAAREVFEASEHLFAMTV